MAKQQKPPPRRRDTAAKALSTPLFRNRVVKNRRFYNRKRRDADEARAFCHSGHHCSEAAEPARNSLMRSRVARVVPSGNSAAGKKAASAISRLRAGAKA